MAKDIQYTAEELNAIAARNSGMKKALAFRSVLEGTPGLADAIPGRVLNGLAKEFFNAVNGENQKKLEGVRTKYKTLAGQYLTTPPSGQQAWRDDVETRLAPEQAKKSIRKSDDAVTERYRQSMMLSENVDSLVTIGTAQALMREAVEAIARRKRIIAETGLENSLDDKALPFSKLILDAIRLANDMLSPFQSKDIAAVAGSGSLALQLIGAKRLIEEKPEDYTAPPPNSIYTGEN